MQERLQEDFELISAIIEDEDERYGRCDLLNRLSRLLDRVGVASMMAAGILRDDMDEMTVPWEPVVEEEPKPSVLSRLKSVVWRY
jgi:hypothetical protein